MRLYKLLALVIPVMLLSACGGGYDDPYDTYYDEYYINWAGSVNGTIVVDATGDEFEFEAFTGYLHFGNTTYTNAWVDDFGNFYVDGFLIGGVYYVESFYGEPITALISNNGYYIDIYGPESDLAWTESWTLPVYAFNSTNTDQFQEQPDYLQSARKADSQSSGKATAPGTDSNAIIEDLPENNQSTLSK
jgi:hypothetical protein